MKQTVEEAAISSQCEMGCQDCPNHAQAYDGYYSSKNVKCPFILGVEWQSKQSPWISVNERLPEPNKLVLCRMVSNGAIVSGYIVVSSGRSPYVATDGGFEFEDWNGYECDMWMPIPSFDDILEANRDVLKRIKEKGD
ncbi:DUF551 domain-containing protein [Phocaeicola vulgatus]|jgi:hypothetical protein|uniref:DUF551 domain-containing protein n=1 Tax=Phocaeicola vulgatus TaxID=821 RepID=UPI0020606000|nr:MAG TPA: Protein of unknown function (DUF551) [Caudoviricetes sp.]